MSIVCYLFDISTEILRPKKIGNWVKIKIKELSIPLKKKNNQFEALRHNNHISTIRINWTKPILQPSIVILANMTIFFWYQRKASYGNHNIIFDDHPKLHCRPIVSDWSPPVASEPDANDRHIPGYQTAFDGGRQVEAIWGGQMSLAVTSCPIRLLDVPKRTDNSKP